MTVSRSKSIALALCATLILATPGCGTLYRGVEGAFTGFSNSGLFHVGRHGELTEEEMQWATIAWNYFENNYNADTGFVNSADRYQAVSMWHVADAIAALHAARHFEFIERKDFDERFSTLLNQLNTMPLAFDKLPNTLYNAATGERINYSNQPEEIGWAIIDIGRLLFWLNVIKAEVPEFSEYIDRIVLRFDYCDAVDGEGGIYSARRVNNEAETFEELGVGYTDYAQIGLRLWGISTPATRKWDPGNTVTIYDVEIDYDSNWARRQGSYGPILSTPYLLGGIEVNWEMPAFFGAEKQDGDYFRDYAEKVYRIQELRYELEGISTARTDHQLNQPPYYLQDSVFGGGYPWSTLSDTGENYPNFALVSTRAVFGMWALWKNDYTDHLVSIIKELYDENRGWYEGRYEVSAKYERLITISTNAMVLQALMYKKNGVLFDVPDRNAYAIDRLSDQFFHPDGCLPEIKGEP